MCVYTHTAMYISGRSTVCVFVYAHTQPGMYIAVDLDLNLDHITAVPLR
jgi:hypothetical protein